MVFPCHQSASASNLCRTPSAVNINAIKVQSNGSLAGGLISGVSGMSATSFGSTQPIKAGVDNFGSDQTPRASQTPRSSSYVAPESPMVERRTDSQNRAALLGVQPLSVEASGGSVLSSGANKQVGPVQKPAYIHKMPIESSLLSNCCLTSPRAQFCERSVNLVLGHASMTKCIKQFTKFYSVPVPCTSK